VTRVRQVLLCDDAELAARREPRTDIVEEDPAGTDRWVARGGPFRGYVRTVTAEPVGEGSWRVDEVTEYRLAIPVWSWLFHFPVRRAIGNRRRSYGYWWAPPDRLDARAATVLGLLCTVQVIDGYLGTVLTQTLTFAADEFGHGNTAQGIVLAAVRAGVLISLVTVAIADRRGRRELLIFTGVWGCAFTVVGALSPAMWFLGGSQLVARGMSTALGILIVIIAAEEMPSRSRAYAASVLVLSAGLGSGMAVWVLPLADLNERGWRFIYMVPAIAILVVRWVGKRLPETRRFELAHLADVQHRSHHSDPDVRARRRRRLILLAVSAFLVAMFAAPASSLQNDFLKDERGFSAGKITLFTIVTSTPAGLGILLGGYLAEARGRRPVGATGLVLGASLTTWAFFSSGFALWGLTLLGIVLGGLTVPALAVYLPEMFGTHDRGRANGTVVTLGVAGSAVGLLVAGLLSDHLGGELGPALALLALGPLTVAGLVLLKYPETAGLELEDLNPEDRPGRDAGTTSGTDQPD
jgi:MFS family permease